MRSEHLTETPATERFIDRLRRAPGRNRPELLVGFLQEQLALAIGLEKADIAPDDRLMELGVDSLKAVEIKIYLEEELGIELNSSLLFDYPTVAALAGVLLVEAGVAGQRPPETGARIEPAVPEADAMNGLSVDRLVSLLQDELDGPPRPAGGGR